MLILFEMTLSSDDANQLKPCILGASDVFAVEKDEFGAVTNVKQRLGKVKQALWHVPFSVPPE